MNTVAGQEPNSGEKRRWVKPAVMTVDLKPTDDVLGACWSSGTASPVVNQCNRLIFGCFR